MANFDVLSTSNVLDESAFYDDVVRHDSGEDDAALRNSEVVVMASCGSRNRAARSQAEKTSWINGTAIVEANSLS